MPDGVDVYHPKCMGVQRLALIRDWVLDCAGRRAEIAYIEGYSYASKFSRAHSLGELGGVVKLALMERGVDLAIVEPSVLKKFATSKGNAGKPDMLDAARREGYEGSNDDNAVDAWWLYQFGCWAAGDHGALHTAYRAAAFDAWLAKREAA
jgi:Holliday junction resolvasome RuvABC endonuclease subunit